MNCNDYKALWHVWTDGDLSGELAGELGGHAAHCKECREWDQSVRGLENALMEIGEEAIEPPPFLKTRILARLEEDRPGLGARVAALFSLKRLAWASMVAVAFLTGMLTKESLIPRNGVGTELQASRVTLEFDAPDADKVGLIGDFNQWGKIEVPIKAAKVGGKWTFELSLAPGRYQYAFEVNGKKWLPDPQAKGIIPDGFGGINSVLYIPAKTDLGIN